MSDLDLDIRTVSSASLGARTSLPDVNQVSDDQSALASNVSGSDSNAAVAASQPSFRYDSFRFTYQSDYGRIVLVDQNPETGQAIAQIPSQKALQLYAEQKRAQELAQSGVGTAHAEQAADVTVHPTANTGQVARGTSLISPSTSGRAPAPLPAVTETIPSPAFIAPKAAPVNITI